MAKVTILKPKVTRMELPLASAKVPAGFPSPAEEYLGDTLDLNQLMIDNPTATFFARVEGDSMVNAGIFEGDILIVDRSVTPKHNSVVVAVIDNEFTVKYLKTDGEIRLAPANPSYKDIKMTGDMELVIWGVVTGISRKL